MAMRQDQARHLRYGFSHPVYTALLCILMAQRMGWTERRVLSLTLAALTMNASIADLQVHMAFQDYPVLDRQRALIRKHPVDSAALLERAGITDCAWLTAVREHHERVDGTGYPTGTTVVDEPARVLRMADHFIACISPRTLRPTMSIQEATRQVFREDNGGPMSRALIRGLGLYPPGDFVQLASGEQGIAIRRGAEARTPLVAVVTNAHGRSVTTTVQRDTAQPEYAITGSAHDRGLLVRVPPERLYGFGVASS
jgi:HD-GYP domain-containing protein (c-di-GMP phosphodiesterase class II)